MMYILDLKKKCFFFQNREFIAIAWNTLSRFRLGQGLRCAVQSIKWVQQHQKYSPIRMMVGYHLTKTLKKLVTRTNGKRPRHARNSYWHIVLPVWKVWWHSSGTCYDFYTQCCAYHQVLYILDTMEVLIIPPCAYIPIPSMSLWISVDHQN
jgi:hypothetical protein